MYIMGHYGILGRLIDKHSGITSVVVCGIYLLALCYHSVIVCHSELPIHRKIRQHTYVELFSSFVGLASAAGQKDHRQHKYQRDTSSHVFSYSALIKHNITSEIYSTA